MKVSDVICPWCEIHPLYPQWNKNSEVYLRCSQPSDFDCPDTTGACKSVEEALSYAKELCESKGLWPANAELNGRDNDDN